MEFAIFDRDPDAGQALGRTIGDGVVPRPRLSAALDRDASLFLLRAPIGFGKSVLVRQWLSEGGGAQRTVAQVRVRPGEGDQDALWISIVDALTDVGIPLPTQVNTRSPQSLAARMMSTARSPLTVWIDNFEYVTAEGADEALIDLAANTDGLQLIVGMRSFRPFSPHALRQTPAVTLSARDLLFTADEIATLLRSAGFDATDELVRTVHDGIGGWPAMMHSLIEAMKRDPGAEVSALMEHVASEWLHELLSRIPNAGIIDFALASSVPATITSDVVRVISDDPSAEALMQRFIASGLLLPERTEAESHYRWTSTARKTLYSELERRAPDRLRTLNERLGHWYAEKGHAERALAHASAAHDWRLVVSTIDRHWRTLMVQHRGELNRAFLQTPAAEFFATPQATASRAIRSLFLQLDEPTLSAAVLPSREEELSELGASADAPAAISTALASLLALRTSPRWGEAITLSDRIVAAVEAARAAQPGSVADLYASVQFFAGETSLVAGDVLTAIARFERAFRRAGDGAFEHLEADAAAKLALSHAIHGNLPVAESWLGRNEHGVRTQPPRTWLAPFMFASRHTAELLLAVDRLDFIAAWAAEIALPENVLSNTLSPYELYARSLLALSTRGAADVLETLDRADAALGPTGRPEHYASLLAMMKADAHLALGNGNNARRILTGPRRDHPLLRTAQARLALLSGEETEALRLATDTEWERRASRRHRMEMLVIEAAAAQRTGDTPRALRALTRAATRAEQTGMLRPFTTAPKADLAELAAALPPSHRSLIELALTRREVYPSSIALIRLTPREQQVLDRIAAGQSIQQIALALQLTYSTVRTQQRSLYRKLGAANRVEALTSARNAGLIGPG